MQTLRGRQSTIATDLADGDELIQLEIAFDVSAETVVNKWPRNEVVAAHGDTIEISWDDIFRAIAPRIAPSATDASVRSGINSSLRHVHKAPPGSLSKKQWISAVRISEGSYNIIKVQFTALGLVTIGKEKLETGKLSGVVWKLTGIGETRMQQILAVRTRRNEDSEMTKANALAST